MGDIDKFVLEAGCSRAIADRVVLLLWGLCAGAEGMVCRVRSTLRG